MPTSEQELVLASKKGPTSLSEKVEHSCAQKKRSNYSGEQKVAILKRHLVNGERISDICDEININPNMYYRWQKIFFENGALQNHLRSTLQSLL